MTTNGQMSARVHQIRHLARSYRVRDILRFTLGAPRMVHELLEAMDRDVAYYTDQLLRRDTDLTELRGRRSVEIEAAGREGYQQGLDAAAARLEAVHAAVDAEDEAEMRTADVLPPLQIGLVYAAALDAKPVEVTGALTMVGRSRHG